MTKPAPDLADLPELFAAMDAMALDELRQVWRRHLGPPPPLRSADILRQLLGWRLQAAAHGGLSLETRNELRGLAGRLKAARLSDGARLTREWKGRQYDVERTSEGYRYDGRTYRSLSQVARAITGVRWNGPRFFGLRQGAAA